MTRRQQLNALRRARRHLQRTTRGYDEFKRTGKGSEWKAAMEALAKLEESLDPPRVPQLGPIVRGGKSILLHDCTHITSGVGYPAFDDGWSIGREVIAPEDLVVTKQSSAQGGDAFYATGASKIRYWIGHIDRAPATGTRFRKGQVMCRISSDHPRPHVHLGIDVVPLTGKALESKTNYTHGAPLIGGQLRRMLGASG